MVPHDTRKVLSEEELDTGPFVPERLRPAPAILIIALLSCLLWFLAVSFTDYFLGTH